MEIGDFDPSFCTGLVICYTTIISTPGHINEGNKSSNVSFNNKSLDLPRWLRTLFLENIFLGQPPDQLLCETWHLMIRPQNEHIPRQHRQTDCMIPILIRSGIKQSIYLGCLVSVFLGAILPYVMDTIGFILSQFLFLLFL